MSQAALLRAIWSQSSVQPSAVPGLRALPTQSLQAGFAAYREHAKALSVRALGQAFPMLLAELGEPDFAGLAWAYARAHPPTQGDAAQWGAHLPSFVAALPGMEPLPPQLAELDWALHRAASSADAPEPDTAMWVLLQDIPADQLVLNLHPSLTLLHLPALPVPAAAAPAADVAVWRQVWQPEWAALPADQALLWRLVGKGESLGTALEQVLAVHPDHDLAAGLALAWQRGWLLGAQRRA